MSRVIYVTALYDYSKPDDSGLSFRRGQVIQVHTQLESGWWDGSCNGERGWFPSNYVSEPEEAIVDNPPQSAETGPSTWMRQVTTDGKITYVNKYTGEVVTEGLGRSSSDSFASSPLHSESSIYQTSAQRRDSGPITLPPNWIVFEAEDGSMVYYNGFTKETRWSPPEGAVIGPSGGSMSASTHSLNSASTSDNPTAITSSPTLQNPITSNGNRMRPTALISARQVANEGLPPNWGRKQTPEGRTYFYNMLTDETTWNISDINMETGELLVKPKRDSTSIRSDSSSDSLRRPSLQDEEAVRWSWARLMNDIITAVHLLNVSSRHNYKEKFIPQSSAIVESIRVMLFASGTARRDAPLVEAHRSLRQHHRHIMATLSKLVLSAKLASGVWPPPDAISKMQASAAEVLQAVRSFVSAAQESGVEIRSQDENGEGPSSPSAVPRRLASGSSSASPSPRGTRQPGEDDDEEDQQPMNSEIIAQLERYTSNVIGMIRELMRSIGGDQYNSSVLITDVRSMVTEVGNFLAVVDDLPLDSLSEDLTVDFKVNRLALYNSISGLVMATSTATGHFAPVNALEQVAGATGLVEKAIKELLISTKFLIEEKESLEQQTLQQYIEQYGGGSSSSGAASPAQGRRGSDQQQLPQQNRARRAISLSVLGPNNLGDIPEGVNKQDGGVDPAMMGGAYVGGVVGNGGYVTYNGYQQQPQQQQIYQHHYMVQHQHQQQSLPSPGPMSAPVTRVANAMMPPTSSAALSALAAADLGDDDKLMASLTRSNTRGKSKIQKILGADAPLVSNRPNKGVGESPTKWYLSYDYAQEDIVFNMEGKVKGGKLESLVERLTLHDEVDTQFKDTFLLTYRSFTNSTIFFNLLVRRYTIQPPPGLSEAEFADWDKSKRGLIRIRVFNVMKTWLENYCSEDQEDKDVLSLLKTFAATTMQEAGGPTAAQLIKLIERREATDGPLRKIIPNSSRDVPPPVLPRNLRRIKFLDLDALEVARQLTILESREYNKLQPVEFLLKAWSDKDSPVAVNVKTLTTMSNQISGWVAQSILSEKDIKKRAQLVKHFVNIADKCRSLNNFNTLMSILAGLGSAPIHRLKRTWELLGSKAQATLESLRSLMNAAKNFSQYRATLQNVNPPCVPFLGFFLTDLTFIEDGSPNSLKGYDSSMINFAKRMKTADVIQNIQQYQNALYQLTHVPELQQFLRQSFVETTDEVDRYNMSLLLEPRERDDEKVARLLGEAGFV